ncbi:MAG: alpha-L-rhamnosidase [Anaerocolumna sp.]|jgi:alpha-L-rhamnosidase|nr:alpha-L-rhamnosidase [Anaerocolumna sp.]
MLTIARIYIENLSEDLVTDNPNPQISFTLESDREKVFLKSALITIGDWSKSTTDQIGNIYDGASLKPFTSYMVQVEVEDNYGDRSSGTMTFHTGRLHTPWQAQWITDTSYQFREKKISPKTMTFRKHLLCNKSVESAKIYATALGIYEIKLNGEKVGRDYFAPGFTSYKNQLQYQTYDVTKELHNSNELIAVVGGGWAVGAFTYKRRNRVYAKRQAFLCEIHITYEDGTREIIGTDETWEVTEEGNYGVTEFYNGEIYDATVDLNKISFRMAGVEKLRINPEITAQYGVPVRGREVMKPIGCSTSDSGMLIYDFGQNFAGVIQAVLNGTRGQKVNFYHAEILMESELYTEPLRTAKQEANYTCIEGKQTYSPKLTYMGFRYVGVTGIEAKDLELTAIALYSDIEENGSFICSNEMINKLQENIRWGAKSNFVDIPTDCPQRDERMGWTGDIALFSPTAAYNFNMSRFLEKWLRDVKAEQGAGGGIPMTVPLVRVPFQWEIMIPMAVDFWGDACILVPWAEYRARGDKRILEKMYPTMKRYMKACKFWAELFSFGKHRRIWKLLHHYGDWCAPGVGLWGWMGRGKWTATACMANSSAVMAEIAAILGLSSDEAYYSKLSKQTSEAYQSVFMDKDCRLKKEFQTAYVLPLYFKMLKEEDRKKAAKHLVDLVRQGNYHINTGFPGTPYILFALADNGYVEDAYKMLLTDTCPSWLYEVKAGGTTIWERWDALREDGTCNTGSDDGTGGMVSFNHYASGAVGDFLYRRIAGIEPVEGGYHTFRIAPIMGGDITKAKAEVNTPYGLIRSEWKLEDTKFIINISVPVGSKCRLTLPSGIEKTLDSGNYQFEDIRNNKAIGDRVQGEKEWKM